jgi:hypothetical protein
MAVVASHLFINFHYPVGENLEFIQVFSLWSNVTGSLNFSPVALHANISVKRS